MMHAMVDFPFMLAIGWIEIIIFILVFVIPLISQLVGGDDKAKEAQRERRQPQPQPKPRPRGQQAKEQPPVGGGRTALEAEIEEFLTRAQGGKETRQQAGTTIQKRDETSAGTRPQKPRADAVSPESPYQPGQSVADHVHDHIQSGPISLHAEQLGYEVGQADEKLEGHIHDVFDHRLGKLDTRPISDTVPQGTDAEVWKSPIERREDGEAARQTRAEEIAKMLGSPGSMQQAIILSEILRRPE